MSISPDFTQIWEQGESDIFTWQLSWVIQTTCLWDVQELYASWLTLAVKAYTGRSSLVYLTQLFCSSTWCKAREIQTSFPHKLLFDDLDNFSVLWVALCCHCLGWYLSKDYYVFASQWGSIPVSLLKSYFSLSLSFLLSSVWWSKCWHDSPFWMV